MLLQPLTNIFCAPAVFPTLLAPGIQTENRVCFSTAFHVGEKMESEANFAGILFQFSSTVNRGSGGPVCMSEAGQMSSQISDF